jgi:hypothetical protein
VTLFQTNPPAEQDDVPKVTVPPVAIGCTTLPNFTFTIPAGIVVVITVFEVRVSVKPETSPPLITVDPPCTTQVLSATQAYRFDPAVASVLKKISPAKHVAGSVVPNFTAR